jgi:AcrR family transcriptional regulator
MTTTAQTPVRPGTRAAQLFGMRVVQKNARDRLLDTAIDLFYTHGFHVIGLDRILAETGVTKTTFYKHFESKDDFVVAAIERRDQRETQAFLRAVRKRAGNDPVRQLHAAFDVLDTWFNAPDFHGCLFINAAAEFPDPRDPAHQAASAHKVRTRDWFRDLAKKAKLTDPELFADQYTALFEGTLILRHVHHKNDAATLAKSLVDALITRHRATAAPNASSAPSLPRASTADS